MDDAKPPNDKKTKVDELGTDTVTETVSKSERAENQKAGDDFILEQLYPLTGLLFEPYRVALASHETIMVVFDTNALLLPYNIGKDDLSALADVYRLLAKQERLFIPARSIREFIKHRDRKLADMIQGLNDKQSKLSAPDPKLSPLLEDVAGYKELAQAATDMQEAKKRYAEAHAAVIKQMKDWQGDDPVTKLYREIFIKSRIIEHHGDQSEILSSWAMRRRNKIPPGYKDGGKDDTGIGDYLIWNTILWLGKRYNKDAIFITGEQKADWYIRSGNEPVYPRPEIIDEYRRASSGRNIRLSTLHELLREMNAPKGVIDEIEKAEVEANTALRNSAETFVLDVAPVNSSVKTKKISFDYSTNDGVIEVTDGLVRITLKFSKASDRSVHLYQCLSTKKIARVKFASPGLLMHFDNFDSSSSSYTISLGEAFLAQNSNGDTLAARVLSITDDSRGSEKDNITFLFNIFKKGELIVCP